MPVCLGLIFDSDQHAIAMPDGRTLSTAGGIPRWYRGAKVSGSAMNEALAARAWHAAGVPHVGGEQ